MQPSSSMSGSGNLRSVHKAVETAPPRLGRDRRSCAARDPEVVRRADRVVVPGQGGFRDCARAMAQRPSARRLLERIRAGTPYLGICLGLQILFEESEEAPGERGLGCVPGRVEAAARRSRRQDPSHGLEPARARPRRRTPHLEPPAGQGAWFYFVHSYHAVPTDPTRSMATSGYGETASPPRSRRDNVFATQFHPEKSQRAGLALLRSFLGT